MATKNENNKVLTTRELILDDARKCVCGEREEQYGSPENSFDKIAGLWSQYLGVNVTSTDVSMMMCLLKIARVKGNQATRDSFVDIAGYAACGGEIEESKAAHWSWNDD